MPSELVVVERMIYESLLKCEKTIFEIVRETNLENNLVRNVLNSLFLKGYIEFKRGIYSPKSRRLNAIESEKDMVEIAEGLAHLKWVEGDEKTYFSFKKVYVDRDDEMILRSMLSSIDSFIKDLQMKQVQNPKTHKIGEKSVVLIGMSQYSRLVDATLKTVS